MERKIVATLTVFLMLLAVVSPVMALAPGDTEEVPTTAEVVSGGGSAELSPYFKWKWELLTDNPPITDDDPDVPCTQVWPWPFAMRELTAYMVATDPNGADDIDRVFIKVFHPDDTEKYQVEADELDKVDDWDEIMWAIEQGVLNECIPPDVADEMIFELEECEARAFKAVFVLHYHQPPGIYTVVAHAVDSYAHVGDWANTFEYYGVAYIDIDFDEGLDFGQIVPSRWQVISGDYNMTTLGKPTVQSGGNLPVWIWLHFTSMVGDTYGKVIEDFDAVFRGERVQFVASADVTFPDPLMPCTTEKMDFSIHAPIGTPADTYRGLLHLAIET